jgi:hypothetical protein
MMNRRLTALSVCVLLSGLLLLSLAGCATNPGLNGLTSTFSPMLLIVWLFVVSAVGVLTGCGSDNSSPGFPPNTFTGGTTTTTGTTGSATSTTGTQLVATALKFSTEPPAQGTVASPLAPFSVEVVDQNGNPFTSGSFTVTLTLAPGSSNGSLSGTLSATTVNGVATFSNVEISMAGTYTLTASATGLASANSTPVVIGVLPLKFASRLDALTNNLPFDNPPVVAVGDVNGDGVPDLVVAGVDNVNTYSSRLADIEVLLGNSNAASIRTALQNRTPRAHQGVISSAAPRATHGFVTSMALGHFHGDSSPADLVLTYSSLSSSKIFVAKGNGDGTFGTPYTLSLPSSFTGTKTHVVTGVFRNEAGKTDVTPLGNPLDIAFASSGSFVDTVAVSDNAGTLTLTPISDSGGYHNISAIAVGHFHTNNGEVSTGGNFLNQDLAVTSSSGSIPHLTLVSISASGSMTFSTTTLAGTGFALAVGNITGDAAGLDGVAVAEYSKSASNTIQTFEASSKGAPTNKQTFTGPFLQTFNLALGFLDGDNKADLMVTGWDYSSPAASLSLSFSFQQAARTSGLVTLKGKGDGTFYSATNHPTAVSPLFVTSGKFDGTTNVDVAVVSGNEGRLINGQASLFLGNGDGTLLGPPPGLAVSGLPRNVEIASINGKPELLGKLENNNGDRVVAIAGNGDGTFGTPVSSQIGATPQSGTRGFAIGDLNGDKIPDIVVGVSKSGNQTVFVMLGNADGSFKSTSISGTANGLTDRPNVIRLADMDGNGTLDIVAGCADGSVAVLLGKGDGTFTKTGAPVATGLPEVDDMAVGNFAGDKNSSGTAVPDVVAIASASGSSNSNLAFLPNTGGTGVLGPAKAVRVPHTLEIRNVVAGDFDGDTKVDLVINNEVHDTQAYALFLKGGGDGTFVAPTASNAGAAMRGTLAMKATDINGDGILDLEVATYYGNNAMVLLGLGNGTFAPAVGFGTGAGARDVAIGDLNGDGKPDLVTANYLSKGITVLLHQ